MFTLARHRLDAANATSKSLAQLLGSPGLREVWHFSFVLDPHWLQQQRPDVVTHVVYGYYKQDTMQRVPGLEYHPVQLHNRWSSHHTKMMILFHDQECQIVIHTANLRAFDWDLLCQGVWVSPMLPRRPNSMSRFRMDLTNYLCAYGLDSLREMATRLRDFDFGEIKDTFIGSVPSNSLNWGLDKITKTLPETELVVCQCSSIATLPEAFLDHMRSKFKTKQLKLVFPSVAQVRDTLGGYASGKCLFYRESTHVRPLIHKWRSVDAFREFLAPHIKTYTGFVGDKVAWVCWTSANMSRAAWGKPTERKRSHFLNFEAGVLRVFDEPQPVAYLRDNKDWMLCYDWPLAKLGGGPENKPWTQEGVYLQQDHFGNTWPIEL